MTGLGLPNGTTTALNSKLDAALAALADDDTATACGSLNAFLNQVDAQTGKKISEGQADDLTAAADGIREALGC